MERGSFCVSIDVELLWGVWDRVTSREVDLCARHERWIARRLLELFRAYDVPATWAIVGRLLDDSRGFDGLQGDRDAWFAPDVVEAIRRDPVAHEIGTHTYSHLIGSEVDRARFAGDLERSKRIHEALGLPFMSLVYPRNEIAHRDVLADLGITAYRGRDPGALEFCRTHAPRLRPIVNVLEKSIPMVPLVGKTRLRRTAPVEIPSSMLFMARNGVRRVVRPAVMRAKLAAGLRAAADERRLFHLWFHPSNFYFEPDLQFDVLESCLALAADLRDRGSIRIRTMAELARAPLVHGADDLAHRGTALVEGRTTA